MSAGTLYIAVKGDTKELITALKSAQSSSVKFGKDTKRDFDLVGSSVNMLKTQVLALGAAWVGTQGIGAVIKIADQYSLLDSKLKLVATDSKDFANIYNELFRISQNTGTSFIGNASAYSNLAVVLRGTGVDSKQLTSVFDTMTKSLVVAGASIQETDSFMLQLKQALGSGRLAGQEFNAVMESNSYFGGLLAKTLGVNVGQLKEMAAEGKITTDVLMDAFPEIAGQVDSDFNKITKTIARAMEELRNAFGDVINDANQAEQGTAKIADSISGLATVITDNKETISNIFSGIIKAAELTVEGIGNVYRSIQGLAIVAASKDKSLADWVLGDPGTMKEWQKEITTGTAFLKDDLVTIREKITDVQQSFGLWGDKKGKLEALRKEESRILEEIKAIETAQKSQTKVTVTGTDKSIAAVKELGKAESIVSKGKEKQSREADKRLKQEVKASTEAAKNITDSWEESYRLREDALEDLEKAENEILKDRERLTKDVTKEIKRLTMSERDYKLDALEEEYEARVKLAGDDKDLQADLVKYKKLKLDEIEAETGHSIVGMLKNWQQFTDGVGDDFGNFISDLITGEFDSLGDAWEGLWKSMLGTAAQYLGNIVAEFAAAKIADFATDLFFSHTGTWDVKNDEKRAVLLKGQMVLPEDVSEQVRNTFGGFSGLSDALETTGPTGFNEFSAAANLAARATMRSLMGMDQNFGMDVAGVGLRAIGTIAGEEIDRLSELDPSSYSSLGHTGMAVAGGYSFGAIGSVVGRAFGGLVGDAIGDLLDDRDFEGVRDAYEDGTISSLEKSQFKAAAQAMGTNDAGFLGGLASKIGNIGRSLADAMGFGSGSDSGNNGFGDTGDGMGDLGRTDASRDSEGAFAHTGGYLLKDEGQLIAQTGEGVLSRVGMKNLDRLNTGKMGGDEDIKPILLAIAMSVRDSAKSLQRALYDGLPVASRSIIGNQLVYAAGATPGWPVAALKEDGTAWLKEDGTVYYKDVGEP